MTVDINKIYRDYGLLILQNLQIGANNKISDFNFYKITQLEKILNHKNIEWEKLSTDEEGIISQIKSLSLI